MFSFFGRLMVDNDVDNALFNQLCTLYDNTNDTNKTWIEGHLIHDLVAVCKKPYDRKQDYRSEWIYQGKHKSTIYLACHVLGTVAGWSKEAASKVFNEPYAVGSLLNLWHFDCNKLSYFYQSGSTWFESRCAARTLSNVFSVCNSNKMNVTMKINQIANKYLQNRYSKHKDNINIVQIALKQYTTWLSKIFVIYFIKA